MTYFQTGSAVRWLQGRDSRTLGQGQGEEDELTIPRAAMNKMIKEMLPNIRVANEVDTFCGVIIDFHTESRVLTILCFRLESWF